MRNLLVAATAAIVVGTATGAEQTFFQQPPTEVGIIPSEYSDVKVVKPEAMNLAS